MHKSRIHGICHLMAYWVFLLLVGYKGSFRVKSPKKNGNLNPTLSNFNEIWYTRLFWPKNPKFQVSAKSDQRFPRYGPFFFSLFLQKGRDRQHFNCHNSATNGPILTNKVSLERRNHKESISGTIFDIWVTFRSMTFWPIFWPWNWPCGTRDLEMTFDENYSLTCYLQHIKKLEMENFSLVSNFKLKYVYLLLSYVLCIYCMHFTIKCTCVNTKCHEC